MVEWLGGPAFDGCLLFDECHKAKNFLPGKESQSTKVRRPGPAGWQAVPVPRRVQCTEEHMQHVSRQCNKEHMCCALLQVASCVIELQQALPLARVVYCSATGVSEVGNMAYMTRMGLWGAGTPFPGGPRDLQRRCAVRAVCCVPWCVYLSAVRL